MMTILSNINSRPLLPRQIIKSLQLLLFHPGITNAVLVMMKP
jgi:hypothetical protein